MGTSEEPYTVESGSKSAYIAEQFAENSPDELEFQYLSEVYSVLVELEDYDGQEEQHLIDHLYEFADEIPKEASTDGQLNGEEVAEQLVDFASGDFEIADLIYEQLEVEGSPEDLVMKKARIYLGDRLRYFERSQHSK